MGNLKECLLNITGLVFVLAYGFMLIMLVLLGLLKFVEVLKCLL